MSTTTVKKYELDAGEVVIQVFTGLPKGQPGSIVSAKEDQEFIVPCHFHVRQHEFMRVTRGYLDCTLDGKTIRATPGMEPVHIKPGVKHSIHKPKGVWSEFSEEAVPDQDGKSNMFRELLAYGPATPLHALTTFYREGDSYPAFPYVPKIVGKLMVWVVGGFFGHYLNLAPRPKLD